jgi:large subunit ribosomal protein L9
MKVILLRDVAKMGKRFSVVEVPDGYALNKLIPQAIAQAATPENLKKIQARTEMTVATQTNTANEFKSAVAVSKQNPVTIVAEANSQNHLFKAVKVADIAQALASAGAAMPTESIKLAEPIKALGEYHIPVSLGGINDVITISVVAK